ERISIPQSVTIPAGETAAVFDLGVIDDDLLTGTQPVVVMATANGYSSASASIEIHDNEGFSLSLHLPDSAHQGRSSAGEIRLDRVAHNAFPIQLTTEDQDWLTLPHQ